MNPVVVIEDWKILDPGPRWGDIRVGDGLSWTVSGALFIVESREIDDGKQVTYVVRCVVPPRDSDHTYGSEGLLSKPIKDRLPDYISIVKPTR